MKYASLKHDGQAVNLGDNIQSVAAEQFLPRLDARFDRDHLNAVLDDRYLIILNGWFPAPLINWPPSESVVPVFFGFHLETDPSGPVISDTNLAYLKRHEPIGCRDRETTRRLAELGVQTFYSKCLSLTFPRREKPPEHGKVFLVDVDPAMVPIPEPLRRDTETVSHLLSFPYPDELKVEVSRYLLDRYRNDARLVITSRIHCAMPCIAMGIPVVFFGKPNDSRISPLEDLGLPIYRNPHWTRKALYYAVSTLDRKLRGSPVIGPVARALHKTVHHLLFDRTVDWDPVALDIETEKNRLIESIRERIRLVEELNAGH